MSYAVVHMQKLKGQAIKGIQFHNQRERDSQTNGDIDKSRSHLNYDLVNPEPINYNEKINQMIQDQVQTKRAIRKDAVKVSGFLVTSDKDFFDELEPEREKEFFEKSLDYFKEKYGEDKIAYATVHKDEKTPHMHVGFVPITEDGRLSAKDFFGHKSALHKLQDEFHKHVNENGFDLDRGVTSNRKHVEIHKFKAMTQAKELEKLESKIEKIKPLNAEIEKLDGIKGITAFNKTFIQKDEFDLLKNTANDSIKLQYELDNTHQELHTLKNEYKDFKHDVSSSQQELRNYVDKTKEEAHKTHLKAREEVLEVRQENNHIRQENSDLEANMNELATDKASELKIQFERDDLEVVYNEGYHKGWEKAKEQIIPKVMMKSDEMTKINSDLNAKNQDLEKRVDDLSIDKETYKQEVTVLRSENEKTDSQIQRLEATNDDLKQENKGLNLQNKELYNQVGNMKQRLYEVVQEVEKFKERTIDKFEYFKDNLKKSMSTFIGLQINHNSEIRNELKDLPDGNRVELAHKLDKQVEEKAEELFEKSDEKAEKKVLENELSNEKEMELGD